MNDLLIECLGEAFQVRNFQSAHGLDRHTQRVIGAAVLSERLSPGPQDPEDLRPIKPLPFTMLAEAHSVPCLGWSGHLQMRLPARQRRPCTRLASLSQSDAHNRTSFRG